LYGWRAHHSIPIRTKVVEIPVLVAHQELEAQEDLVAAQEDLLADQVERELATLANSFAESKMMKRNIVVNFRTLGGLE
jgi:hypothetical protein